jgi:hypothetical protein
MAANKTAHEATMPKPLLSQSMKRANLSKAVKTSLQSINDKGPVWGPRARLPLCNGANGNNARALLWRFDEFIVGFFLYLA